MTANFLQSIEEELARQQHRPVLRIEVEPTTPPALRDLLQRELRFEESERESTLSPADVYVAGGPIDLGGLHELAPAARGEGGLADYPPLVPADRFVRDRPISAQLYAHHVLVPPPHAAFPPT